MNNIFIGALTNWAQTGMMWNIALNSQGSPKLPGASSCNEGCRGVVTIDGSSVTLNQECPSVIILRDLIADPSPHLVDYAIAHASKAIQPVDGGSDFGQRIQVSSSSQTLLVGAYSTKAAQGSRISLVVLNSGNSNAQTTIMFQNKQVCGLIYFLI